MITPDQIRSNARSGQPLRKETLMEIADQLEKQSAATSLSAEPVNGMLRAAEICAHEFIHAPQVSDSPVCHKCGESESDDNEVLFALEMSMEHDDRHQAMALRTWMPRIRQWAGKAVPNAEGREANVPSQLSGKGDGTPSGSKKETTLNVSEPVPSAPDAGQVVVPVDPVVGHKTLSDGAGGFRHEPLRKSEADAMLARIELSTEQRRAAMPDEQSAINAMFNAWQRLKEFGWNDAIYCPKDGSTFSVLESGSTGIHAAHYQGDWPTGGWLIHAEGDLWPSRPVLYKPRAAGSRHE